MRPLPTDRWGGVQGARPCRFTGLDQHTPGQTGPALSRSNGFLTVPTAQAHFGPDHIARKSSFIRTSRQIFSTRGVGIFLQDWVISYLYRLKAAHVDRDRRLRASRLTGQGAGATMTSDLTRTWCMQAGISWRTRPIRPLYRAGHRQSGLPRPCTRAPAVSGLAPLLALVLLLGAPSLHASPLSGCAEHFIEGEVANAPTLFDSAPTEPFNSNRHLCYHVEGTSFFAMEYWPERFAPRWTTYRLSGERFGPGACNTYTRSMGNCYINDDEWTEPFECERSSDPFHTDHLLEGDALGDRAFVNSGHDRGHIAPRQALSWHVCGAYQTFTMANMSPQNAAFNQGTWGNLEHQVLTWAVDNGPLHVVSGTTCGFFSHWRFSVHRDGALDPDQIYPRGSTLEDAAEQMSANAEAFSATTFSTRFAPPIPTGSTPNGAACRCPLAISR